MLRVRMFRKWWAVGLSLVVLLSMLAASPLWINFRSDTTVQAQGNQPENTLELFKPFWEAWQLLHDNYVDPLDDHLLAEGAVTGMVRAVDDPEFALEVPTIPAEAEDVAGYFDPFWQLWETIHTTYGTALDDNALMEGALRGMMASIGDRHTDYMDPETFARVNESMSGEYEGIGATVRQNEDTGGLELVTIFKGSPAQEAGLHAGDQIVRVEGQDVTVLTQEEIIALVRGPAGTLVRLGILRSGEAEELKFEVMRGKITVPSVDWRVLDNGVGYMWLSQFEFNTTQEMLDGLAKMDANNLPGLILDLRGNPGGYLTTSIEVASAYIRSGNVLIERSPDQEVYHAVLGDPLAPDVPMVVLVDQGSASASELIAGALQDHQRAIIVGMPTFGKGSVQTWRQLSNGGGIRITISRWYTPDGHSVSDVGIQPDIIVAYQPPEAPEDDPDNQLTTALQVLEGTYQPVATAPAAEPTPAAEASQ